VEVLAQLNPVTKRTSKKNSRQKKLISITWIRGGGGEEHTKLNHSDFE
jgi:hypothetical protein